MFQIGAADPTLDALRLGALADDPKAGRPVVAREHDPRRREGAGLEALVGVDVGRQEPGKRAGVGELAADELTHQLGHARWCIDIEEERRRSVRVP